MNGKLYYLTKKFSSSLSHTTGAAFALTIAFTLCADIIPQQCTEHKVLLWGKLVEGTSHHNPYGIHTFLLSEEQVQTVVAYGLYDIINVLPFESFQRECLVFFVESKQNHLSDALLELIYMVHQDLHVYRHYHSLLHFFSV